MSVPGRLEVDRTLVGLFHTLSAARTRGTAACDVEVADTVSYTHGSLRWWYKYEGPRVVEQEGGSRVQKPGQVVRKDKRDCTPAKIEAAFTRGVADEDTSTPVATFLYRSRSTLADYDTEAAPISIEFLDRAGLHTFLHHRESKPDGILQRFGCVGVHNSVTQVVWTPYVSRAIRYQNVNKMHNSRAGLYQRCVTHEGKSHLAREVVCPPHTVEELSQICRRVSCHYHSVEHRLVTRLVLYFKVNAQRRFILLYPSSVVTSKFRPHVSRSLPAPQQQQQQQQQLADADSPRPADSGGGGGGGCVGSLGRHTSSASQRTLRKAKKKEDASRRVMLDLNPVYVNAGRAHERGSARAELGGGALGWAAEEASFSAMTSVGGGGGGPNDQGHDDGERDGEQGGGNGGNSGGGGGDKKKAPSHPNGGALSATGRFEAFASKVYMTPTGVFLSPVEVLRGMETNGLTRVTPLSPALLPPKGAGLGLRLPASAAKYSGGGGGGGASLRYLAVPWESEQMQPPAPLTQAPAAAGSAPGTLGTLKRYVGLMDGVGGSGGGGGGGAGEGGRGCGGVSQEVLGAMDSARMCPIPSVSAAEAWQQHRSVLLTEAGGTAAEAAAKAGGSGGGVDGGAFAGLRFTRGGGGGVYRVSRKRGAVAMDKYLVASAESQQQQQQRPSPSQEQQQQADASAPSSRSQPQQTGAPKQRPASAARARKRAGSFGSRVFEISRELAALHLPQEASAARPGTPPQSPHGAAAAVAAARGYSDDESPPLDLLQSLSALPANSELYMGSAAPQPVPQQQPALFFDVGPAAHSKPSFPALRCTLPPHGGGDDDGGGGGGETPAFAASFGAALDSALATHFYFFLSVRHSEAQRAAAAASAAAAAAAAARSDDSGSASPPRKRDAAVSLRRCLARSPARGARALPKAASSPAAAAAAAAAAEETAVDVARAYVFDPQLVRSLCGLTAAVACLRDASAQPAATAAAAAAGPAKKSLTLSDVLVVLAWLGTSANRKKAVYYLKTQQRVPARLSEAAAAASVSVSAEDALDMMKSDGDVTDCGGTSVCSPSDSLYYECPGCAAEAWTVIQENIVTARAEKEALQDSRIAMFGLAAAKQHQQPPSPSAPPPLQPPKAVAAARGAEPADVCIRFDDDEDGGGGGDGGDEEPCLQKGGDNAGDVPPSNRTPVAAAAARPYHYGMSLYSLYPPKPVPVHCATTTGSVDQAFFASAGALPSVQLLDAAASKQGRHLFAQSPQQPAPKREDDAVRLRRRRRRSVESADPAAAAEARGGEEEEGWKVSAYDGGPQRASEASVFSVEGRWSQSVEAGRSVGCASTGATAAAAAAARWSHPEEFRTEAERAAFFRLSGLLGRAAGVAGFWGWFDERVRRRVGAVVDTHRTLEKALDDAAYACFQRKERVRGSGGGATGDYHVVAFPTELDALMGGALGLALERVHFAECTEAGAKEGWVRRADMPDTWRGSIDDVRLWVCGKIAAAREAGAGGGRERRGEGAVAACGGGDGEATSVFVVEQALRGLAQCVAVSLQTHLLRVYTPLLEELRRLLVGHPAVVVSGGCCAEATSLRGMVTTQTLCCLTGYASVRVGVLTGFLEKAPPATFIVPIAHGE